MHISTQFAQTYLTLIGANIFDVYIIQRKNHRKCFLTFLLGAPYIDTHAWHSLVWHLSRSTIYYPRMTHGKIVPEFIENGIDVS